MKYINKLSGEIVEAQLIQCIGDISNFIGENRIKKIKYIDAFSIIYDNHKILIVKGYDYLIKNKNNEIKSICAKHFKEVYITENAEFDFGVAMRLMKNYYAVKKDDKTEYQCNTIDEKIYQNNDGMITIANKIDLINGVFAKWKLVR